MKFNLRKLEESDYKLLIQWWEQWGWQAPPQEFLPENGAGGFIVSTEETPLCAGFIYFSNSKVAWIDWIISNKESLSTSIAASISSYVYCSSYPNESISSPTQPLS